MVRNGAVRVPVNPVQDRGNPQNLHGDPHLFRQLPPQGLLQGLPQLHQTAGETPNSPGRLLAPEHQKHFFTPEDDGAHPHQGLLGIMTLH